MAAHPMPAHRVMRKRVIEALPQVGVLHRLPVGGLPAIALPAVDPGHDAVAEILAVGMDVDRAGPLERLERRARGPQLHPVVGGVRLAGLDLGGVIAPLQNRAVSAGSGIAGAGAVGMDGDATLGHVLASFGSNYSG